jgi:uncharacterized cupredoxin-like copper-binding protein
MRGAQNLPTIAAATSTSLPTPPADLHTIIADERDFKIDLNPADVKAGAIVFAIHNAGPSPHDLAVTKNDANYTLIKGSETIDAGKTTTLSLDLQPGTYRVICTIPGHRQLGMDVPFTVQ